MKSSQNIAKALKNLHKIIKKNHVPIVQSHQISREDRELLSRTKWLQEIIKGWWMLVRPDILPGDSTVWYANFWDFLRLYLDYHYGKNYCLSAESSLDLQLGNTITPKQVIVIAKQGGGFSQALPFDTSVLVYADPEKLPKKVEERRGLRVMTLPQAICRVTPAFFQKNPEEAQIALQSVQNPADLIEVISNEKIQRPAARLASAYRFLGDEQMARAIESVLEDSGVRIKEENPFHTKPLIITRRILSPYHGRILTLWNSMREDVVRHFPKPKKLNLSNIEEVIDELYVQDAYNSLSIEGYVVDEALIERVKNGLWNPDNAHQDKTERNALAARGYFEAHNEVKQTLNTILKGKNPGDAFADDLSKWHYALFSPSVQAGILEKKDLFGYRTGPIYIRNARHVPPPREAILDAMDALFTCLRQEKHPGVRATLGHYLFVYIHPYIDGNGRLARFLMNVQMVSGGYPWTIIRVEDREEYMQALGTADLEKNIVPLVKLLLKSKTK